LIDLHGGKVSQLPFVFMILEAISKIENSLRITIQAGSRDQPFDVTQGHEPVE
jgi:hypothetical protein